MAEPEEIPEEHIFQLPDEDPDGELSESLDDHQYYRVFRSSRKSYFQYMDRGWRGPGFYGLVMGVRHVTDRSRNEK